jgi:sec-independent protein translocase protein TatB
MLDLGLTKMALIGVVALVVLGPERLPRVARTAGALFGRAQRYINDVKAEVTREIELDALRQMKTDFESAARNVENSIHDNLRKHEAELNDAFRNGSSTSASIAGGAAAEDAAGSAGASFGASSWRTTTPPTAKRVSWRAKRSTAPVWYKRAVGRRTHVQSGAARIARHTPASLRKQRRFL